MFPLTENCGSVPWQETSAGAIVIANTAAKAPPTFVTSLSFEIIRRIIAVPGFRCVTGV
jgi:hypothetical protein